MSYAAMCKFFIDCEPFKDIGSNSGQQTLKLLDKSWKSFFISIKDWSKNPSKYLGKPKLPKYKDKNGRHIFVMTNMQTHIYDSYLYFAFKPFKPFNNLFRTNVTGKLMQTRFIPRGSDYVLEIVYEVDVPEVNTESSRIIGIDLGLNNFATIQNNIGMIPIVINGKGVKSINEYYNMKLSKYQSTLKKTNNKYTSKRLQKLSNKRHEKIEYFLHCTSKKIIDYCLDYDMGTIVIGRNKEWKQDINLCNNTNRKFVQIPHYEFINKLRYKAENVGIRFIETEESYTSKANFLNFDPMIKGYDFTGKRIKRGLYKTIDGQLINADVNGASNIIRKVFPNAFANGIKGVGLHPIVVNV